MNYSQKARKNLLSNFMILVVIAIGIGTSILLFQPYLFPKVSADEIIRVAKTKKTSIGVSYKEEFATAHADAIYIENALYEEETTVEETQDEEETSVDETTTEETTIEEETGYDEFEDRCRMTYAESGLEDIEGQIAVAAVIINREQNSNFPNTFKGVITQSGAFSSVQGGEIYIMTANPYVLDYEDIPERTIEATQRAINGEDPTEQLLWNEAVRLGLDPQKYAEGGALFFYNPSACSAEALAERANI